MIHDLSLGTTLHVNFIEKSIRMSKEGYVQGGLNDTWLTEIGLWGKTGPSKNSPLSIVKILR